MARPVKQGLDYFPLDVDFFADEKIEAISGEFGIKGELTVVKLLCAIYRNGYFVLWCDLMKMKLLKRLPGVNAELLEQIVRRLVRWGFFDKALFDSANVLTSSGIQKRFAEATARRHVIENRPHWLLDSRSKANEIAQDFDNDDINGVNAYINPRSTGINECISTQSKVKESKVNINNAEELTPREAEGFSAAAAATAESAEMDSAGGKYPAAFVKALDAIGARFKTDGRCYARMLESLLRAIQSERSDGLQMVYDALKRLDSAEAVKSGKVRLSITGFLKPETFLRLLNGDYDVDYSDRPGLGLPLSTPRKRQTTKAITPPQAPGSIEDIY